MVCDCTTSSLTPKRSDRSRCGWTAFCGDTKDVEYGGGGGLGEALWQASTNEGCERSTLRLYDGTHCDLGGVGVDFNEAEVVSERLRLFNSVGELVDSWAY